MTNPDIIKQNIKPNRLVNEKSPYLLQHAHNPVDWFPWGVEAFAKAKEDNKPIFVSIGYSTCHWCHVRKRYYALIHLCFIYKKRIQSIRLLVSFFMF